MLSSSQRRGNCQDAHTVGAHSNKSVKSDLTYQRYTDWDSSSGSRITSVDARDECSSKSYGRNAAYDNERELAEVMICARSQHQHHPPSENASVSASRTGTSRRGRMRPQDQLITPMPIDAEQPRQLNAEDDTSVRTTITNSRSVTSPERIQRNSRYEPASKMSHPDSTKGLRDVMPSDVIPELDPNNERNHSYTSKPAQLNKHPNHWTEDREPPEVNSVSDESRLLSQYNCYSSVGTYTIMSAKPPLGPRTQDTTPKIKNKDDSHGNTLSRIRGNLRLSNTSVSSFTRDDDTMTLENSIPSALEFVTKSDMSAISRNKSNNPDHQSEMKYWMDLSVRVAISVMEAKGSESIAEKAATTVVETGSKINLREKKRVMQQVLKFLATKTSVAVLEAGGSQKIATAVAHTIMIHDTFPDDLESLTESEVDRSTMLSQIDRSISKNLRRPKNITRISDLTKDQKDDLSKKVKGNISKVLPSSSTLRSEDHNVVHRSKSVCSKRLAAAAADNNRKSPSKNPPKTAHHDNTAIAPMTTTQATSTTSKSDITISKSNLSFEKSSHHTESRSQSLSVKEKAIEQAARLNAQREQEINKKMAALDEATNALLAKANNVQHYIDQQIAQRQQPNGECFPAGISKEFQTALSCDDPGYHHNFDGRSFHVDNKYRLAAQDKGKSVFEKLTNGLTQILDFTCTAPTTGTNASSGNITTQFSSYALEKRQPNSHFNGDMMDSNYIDTFAYSEKNEDANDMISALTEDVPVHKRWQRSSRLTLVTDHQRLSDCNTEKDSMHNTNHQRHDQPIERENLMAQSFVKHNRDQAIIHKRNEGIANNLPDEIYSPAATQNIEPSTTQSMHQAFNSAMDHLSAQLMQEPFNSLNHTGTADLTQKPNKSSTIGKLKSAFVRKRTPKSVTFGGETEEPPVTPKSPGRMFFGKRRNDPSEC